MLRKKLDSDLKERVKELECLYGISRILDKLNANRDRAYSEVLTLIRSAFKYPTQTGVRITIYTKSYRTDNFRPTRWIISRSIKIGSKSIGELTVNSLKNNRIRSPFLKEEGKLLTAVAKRIGIAAERLQMAVQLKNSERFYRSLFGSANEGILLHYPDGRIGIANKAMARMSGYSIRELLDMNITDFLVYQSDKRVPRTLDKMPVKYTAQRRQLTLKTKNGDVRFVEVTDNRLANAERTVVTQTIVRDITEEKQQRETIHAYTGQVINAQENERKRIARELHDETIQALLSLGMDIDATIRTEKNMSPNLSSRLGDFRNRAKKIGDGVKNLTRALRPPMLDEVGLVTALRWLVTEVTRREIETQFEVIGNNQRLAPEIEVTIFRIAQEALNNVVKHSRATNAKVYLKFAADSLSLVVIDNGRGFDINMASTNSSMATKMGLIGMDERARLLNGTLRIESAEKGTKVILEVSVL